MTLPRLTRSDQLGLTRRWLTLIIAALALGGCVNATVDEMTYNEPTAGIGESSVVILGRRHAPDYDTEFDFIECIGDHIHSGDPSIEVINELAFINELYPWFEPRTAPCSPVHRPAAAAATGSSAIYRNEVGIHDLD